ncbi:MAG: hypothetical protein J6Z33_01830 [Lachnospiraceae bacterium]|nr:hypothetical protein [Lachnospiraceae bacterium]
MLWSGRRKRLALADRERHGASAAKAGTSRLQEAMERTLLALAEKE